MGQQSKAMRASDEAAMTGVGMELAVEDEAPTVHSSAPASKPASQKSADPCGRCGSEQSAIRINVDGNTLLMESCDTCDVRRWQLEGERIDLQEALNQVGEHSGRKRPRT